MIKSYLHLNGLTWEFHEPNSKFQDDKLLEQQSGG